MNARLAILVVVVLLLIGGGIAIIQQRRIIMRLNIENEQLVKVASDSGRIARTYINLFGNAVSKNKVLDLTLRNARAIQAQELVFVKQFEGVKKNMKNLDAAFRTQSKVLLQLKLKVRDTIHITATTAADAFHAADTVDAKTLYYQDEYNFVSGIVTSDSAQLYAEIQVPIDGVTYWQRKHKFIFKNWRIGKKEYFSELTSPNKWVHISQHEFINVGRKK